MKVQSPKLGILGQTCGGLGLVAKVEESGLGAHFQKGLSLGVKNEVVYRSICDLVEMVLYSVVKARKFLQVYNLS